jgi:hypothetical protein
MRRLRLGLAILLMGLLALGYFASQKAALSGDAPAYAKRVDIPAVKWLALLGIVTVVGLGLIPDRETNGEAEQA